MPYFITPIDEKRGQKWERTYGRSQLPVIYPEAHVACTQRWGDVPVYYLDTTAVPEALLDRLAAVEARRMGISYTEARLSVRREWLIKAEGCRLEESARGPWQPAFSFLRQVPLYRRSNKMPFQRAAQPSSD